MIPIPVVVLVVAVTVLGLVISLCGLYCSLVRGENFDPLDSLSRGWTHLRTWWHRLRQ